MYNLERGHVIGRINYTKYKKQNIKSLIAIMMLILSKSLYFSH